MRKAILFFSLSYSPLPLSLPPSLHLSIYPCLPLYRSSLLSSHLSSLPSPINFSSCLSPPLSPISHPLSFHQFLPFPMVNPSFLYSYLSSYPPSSLPLYFPLIISLSLSLLFPPPLPPSVSPSFPPFLTFSALPFSFLPLPPSIFLPIIVCVW